MKFKFNRLLCVGLVCAGALTGGADIHLIYPSRDVGRRGGLGPLLRFDAEPVRVAAPTNTPLVVAGTGGHAGRVPLPELFRRELEWYVGVPPWETAQQLSEAERRLRRLVNVGMLPLPQAECATGGIEN